MNLYRISGYPLLQMEISVLVSDHFLISGVGSGTMIFHHVMSAMKQG